MAYHDSRILILLSFISMMMMMILPVLALNDTERTFCYTSLGAHGVQSEHCEKAMEKIIYNSNHTLDNVSGSLTVFHKSCVINIKKPKRATPTKVDIETMIHGVTRSCPATGGVLVKSSLIAIIYRSNKHNNYAINRHICATGNPICTISTRDCLDAFESLPVNKHGTFMAQETVYNSANITKGSCRVKNSSTDYAPFRT